MPLNPAGQSPTMGSSFGPLPGNGNQSSPQGGISTLLGNNTPSLPQTGPSPQEMVQSYMSQVQNLHSLIDALALDHPEAAEELNNAKNQLTSSMSKVASAMTAPDKSPQPKTF